MLLPSLTVNAEVAKRPVRRRWGALVALAKRHGVRRVAEMDGQFTYYACVRDPDYCEAATYGNRDRQHYAVCCDTVLQNANEAWLHEIALAGAKSSVFMIGGGPIYAWREMAAAAAAAAAAATAGGGGGGGGMGQWDFDFDLSLTRRDLLAVLNRSRHGELSAGLDNLADAPDRGVKLHYKRALYGYAIQQSALYPWDALGTVEMRRRQWAPPMPSLRRAPFWGGYLEQPYGDLVHADLTKCPRAPGAHSTIHVRPETHALPMSICMLRRRAMPCPFAMREHVLNKLGMPPFTTTMAPPPPNMLWLPVLHTWIKKPSMPSFTQKAAASYERCERITGWSVAELEAQWHWQLASVYDHPEYAGTHRGGVNCTRVRSQMLALCSAVADAGNTSSSCVLRVCPPNSHKIWLP
jgi:hypothetical protein